MDISAGLLEKQEKHLWSLQQIHSIRQDQQLSSCCTQREENNIFTS